MRALPSLRALALPASALLTSGACSLMAPSDVDLLGEAPASSGAAPREGSSAESQGGNAVGGASATDGGSGAEATEAGGSPGLSASGGDGSGTGDFSSLIPQSGLALWLMADHGIGEVDGGGVAVWADFSTNEADAKQSISSLQPKLVTGKGSLPLLQFDGADDQLALPEGFEDFSAGLSLFVIAKPSLEQNCPSLLQLSNQPEEQDIELGGFFGAVHYEVADDELSGPDNTFGLGQLVLVGVSQAPGNPPELRLNGVFMASGSFTSLPEVKRRTNNFIGRSLYQECEPFGGGIGEVIVYTRALDAAERGVVQRYLQGKWSYEPPVKTKPGPGELPAAN